MKKRTFTPARQKMAQGQHGLALGWLKRGRVKQAILSLKKALSIEEEYLDAYLELGRIYLHLHRWQDLIDLCRQGLKQFIEVPELHKMCITAMEERGSIDDAFALYRLERVDRRCLDIEPQEILCCVAVRNEGKRLPGFVRHYRRLGVDRFFFVDNGSRDGSVDWLLEQPDVHVWRSDLSFKRSNFGSSWFELLLRRYGVNHWCLTVDADEHLVYDQYETRSLQAFCRDLAARDIQAASGLLLDMYGKDSVCRTPLDPDGELLEACPFFDREAFHTSHQMGGQYRNQTIFWGGVRQRVFPAEHDYLLSKVPLLRYRPDVVLTSGQHLTNIPAERVAGEQVCVLHFKFVDTFAKYARQEAAREVHAMGGEQYKSYARTLDEVERVTLYDPNRSVRFQGVAQLQDLGIMRREPVTSEPDFPRIEPVAEAGDRPFWSVMITVYNRLHNLERAVGSVLKQATQDMHIMVVNDGAEKTVQDELAKQLRAIAGDRVGLACLETNLGHPHVFNECIRLARGKWVHILHDDDWVEPGFYETLRKGIDQVPEVGAAFCQHAIVASKQAGPEIWNSWVERETPGVITDWLQRIGVECRVQFSAMTVKRRVYERLGGFCPEALSAFDWEMWKRIAASYPVWYAPEILARVGRDESALSSALLRSGEQVVHSLRTVDISQGYLPRDQAGRLSDKARERFALYALDVARRYLKLGDREAALANLRAALVVPPRGRVQRVLNQVLSGIDHEYAP